MPPPSATIRQLPQRICIFVAYCSSTITNCLMIWPWLLAAPGLTVILNHRPKR